LSHKLNQLQYLHEIKITIFGAISQKLINMKIRIIASLALLILSINQLSAAYLKNIPQTIYQPDGEIIECFASGDEYFNYLHDVDGYTIIQNKKDGYYYYAVKEGDNLVPSEYLVNSVDPRTVGIEINAMISEKAYYEKVERYNSKLNGKDAPTSGTIQNLNIFIRFSDEDEFTETRSHFDALYNDEENPSLIHYYREVSYNVLDVYTSHYPTTDSDINISYQDSHPRSYYKPYSSSNPNGYQEHESAEREHTLLKNALMHLWYPFY